MKKLFRVRIITMIIFLIFLFGFSILNFTYSLPYIKQAIYTENTNKHSRIREIKNEDENFHNKIKNTIEENILGKGVFVEAYGYIQELMEKNEFSNFKIIKDNNDNLHYSYFDKEPNNMDELVRRTINFREFLDNKGIEYLHIVPTSKYSEVNDFEIGIPVPLENTAVDSYLDELSKENIPYLDLRAKATLNKIPDEEEFYKTDHHWTIQSSFWAFTEIVTTLNQKFDSNIDPKGYYTDIENYNKVLYESSFLGSIGRKTGINYAGVDDFTLITPKFDTKFSSTFISEDGSIINKNGSFEDAIVNQEPFENIYELKEEKSDKYSSYLWGNWPFVSIKNEITTNNNKILIIKDSFSVPVAAFLSTVFKEVDLVDPRYIEESIEDIINKSDYDYVITLFSTPNYNEEFFKFGM